MRTVSIRVKLLKNKGNILVYATVKDLKMLEARVCEAFVPRKEFEEFVEVYNDGRDQDMLAFADQSERSDYSSNLLKANCVLLTGTDLKLYGI